MQAFPKDSLNMSLGGAGPLNANPDHATFMGVGNEEAFRDYSKGIKHRAGEPIIFDSSARGSIIHGDETHGLGTSTFLEGTPAARTTIARRQAEQAQEADSGLQRKKSLAQRIRHINKSQREFAPSGRLTNPEGFYSKRSPDPMPTSGGSDNNPFFSEYSKGEESISVRPREQATSPSGPPAVPRRGSAGNALERRATTEGPASEERPTGILGRMKSFKGGRKPRSDSANNATTPGTAV